MTEFEINLEIRNWKSTFITMNTIPRIGEHIELGAEGYGDTKFEVMKVVYNRVGKCADNSYGITLELEQLGE